MTYFADESYENADLRIGRQEAAWEAACHREYKEERHRVEQARISRKLARACRRPSIVLPPEPPIVFSDADDWD
jgi:hypothetical protein